MYTNIGKKIKGLAKAIFGLFSIPSIIAGIILIVLGFRERITNIVLVTIGVVVMIVVPLISWISSWFLYGFGELIDKTCAIERNTRGVNSEVYERQNKIETLYSDGYITEEEYKVAMSKYQQAV